LATAQTRARVLLASAAPKTSVTGLERPLGEARNWQQLSVIETSGGDVTRCDSSPYPSAIPCEPRSHGSFDLKRLFSNGARVAFRPLPSISVPARKLASIREVSRPARRSDFAERLAADAARSVGHTKRVAPLWSDATTTLVIAARLLARTVFRLRPMFRLRN
jgi:hypothetical protein